MIHYSKKDIEAILTEVFDPEIPALNIVDLGVLRQVDWENGKWTITITPTYSGCPAMKVIEEDIATIFAKHGVSDYRILTVLAPAWTTAWLTENGRKRLLESGIAPPLEPTADKKALITGKSGVNCPFCKSPNTRMISQFGSTACKALWKCESCLEPFDYFKCL